eukprot:28596-Eustigmatos_ZCMA.PRE.1
MGRPAPFARQMKREHQDQMGLCLYNEVPFTDITSLSAAEKAVCKATCGANGAVPQPQSSKQQEPLGQLRRPADTETS